MEPWVNTNSEVYQLVLVSVLLEVVGEGGGAGGATELLVWEVSVLVDEAMEDDELVCGGVE